MESESRCPPAAKKQRVDEEKGVEEFPQWVQLIIDDFRMRQEADRVKREKLAGVRLLPGRTDWQQIKELTRTWAVTGSGVWVGDDFGYLKETNLWWLRPAYWFEHSLMECAACSIKLNRELFEPHQYWYQRNWSCVQCDKAGFQAGNRNCPCMFVSVCSCGTAADMAEVVARCSRPVPAHPRDRASTIPCLMSAALQGRRVDIAEANTATWTLAGCGIYRHSDDTRVVSPVRDAPQRTALRQRLALHRNAWTGASTTTTSLGV